mmetsp:Transcript_9336/g.25368  ORF Transcript_9336/g.25368 Transcript_9336/m.25368 type:complete len:292 (-) Transcript_9336:106-981(-)
MLLLASLLLLPLSPPPFQLLIRRFFAATAHLYSPSPSFSSSLLSLSLSSRLFCLLPRFLPLPLLYRRLLQYELFQVGNSARSILVAQILCHAPHPPHTSDVLDRGGYANEAFAWAFFVDFQGGVDRHHLSQLFFSYIKEFICTLYPISQLAQVHNGGGDGLHRGGGRVSEALLGGRVLCFAYGNHWLRSCNTLKKGRDFHISRNRYFTFLPVFVSSFPFTHRDQVRLLHFHQFHFELPSVVQLRHCGDGGINVECLLHFLLFFLPPPVSLPFSLSTLPSPRMFTPILSECR